LTCFAWRMSPWKLTSTGSVAFLLRARFEYLATGFNFFGVTGFASSFFCSSFFGVCLTAPALVAVLFGILVGVLVGVGAALASGLVFCGRVSMSECSGGT